MWIVQIQILKILGTASLELRGDLASQKGEYDKARRLLEQADQKEKEIGYSEPPQYSRPALEVLGAAGGEARLKPSRVPGLG